MIFNGDSSVLNRGEVRAGVLPLSKGKRGKYSGEKSSPRESTRTQSACVCARTRACTCVCVGVCESIKHVADIKGRAASATSV